MFMKAYANRTKAMILYATETGKSLGFGKQLAHVFSKAFKSEVSDNRIIIHFITNFLFLVVFG